jgi:hypothetical protein
MPYDASGIVAIRLALCPALQSCHVLLGRNGLVFSGPFYERFAFSTVGGEATLKPPTQILYTSFHAI